MTDRQTRLIASSVIVLAGGVTYAVGETAQGWNKNADDVGVVMLVVGGLLFLANYFGFDRRADAP